MIDSAMSKHLAMHRSQRCTAHSKRTGLPCKNPAVRGWTVCRMHGAMGGQGSGKANPAYQHGLRSMAHCESRKLISQLARLLSELDVTQR